MEIFTEASAAHLDHLFSSFPSLPAARLSGLQTLPPQMSSSLYGFPKKLLGQILMRFGNRSKSNICIVFTPAWRHVHSACLSLWLSVIVNVCQCPSIFFFLSLSLSFLLFLSISVCPCLFLSVEIGVCLSLSVCVPLCLSESVCVCLLICLCRCLFAIGCSVVFVCTPPNHEDLQT